ncbi:hypothetical protein [Martelella endophytica]|uniref:Tat pathway signal sequence domain protein n=1 Tax=Martelella endophytica TaxID=1486262 RepID=A0A0D5LLG4_MAREN|nr:hypothetical protein [Martelella endophytica]AJY44607.1 hypothetical protein TM49_01190 [Martelella endophytica]
MKLFASAAVALFALSQPLMAQEAASTDAETTSDAPAPAGLSISLNSLETTENGCKLTFVVDNELAETIESLQTEVALFNAEGVVDRLTMLDFLTLPAGKKRVRQFELPGQTCDALGGLLLNDIKVCEAGGADCMANLTTDSKAGIPFDG